MFFLDLKGRVAELCKKSQAASLHEEGLIDKVQMASLKDHPHTIIGPFEWTPMLASLLDELCQEKGDHGQFDKLVSGSFGELLIYINHHS